MTFFPPATRISFYSPSNAQTLLSINPGWYFIQIISAISMIRLNEIQTLTNITFTTRYLVYPGCYSFYLVEEQLNILQRYKELYVYPSPQSNIQSSRKILSYSETSRCKIKSIPNWKPQDRTIQYSSFSNDIYIVNTTCSSLLPDNRIEYLSPYSGLKIQNRYNTGFIQSGSQDGILENGSLTSPHPIFNLGIHGENQLISIIDTGVDFNHAFFKDPSPEFEKTIKINTTMKNHRKIEKYYNFANAGDGENGHGTHCGGILAGESYLNESGLILYSGMAPKARLVVADVGFGGRDLDGEFDQFELFNLFEADGVSICSNSWGFDANEETRIDTMMYDYIGFLHPEMLLVFAAGNEARSRPFFYTINSPGDSKNLLSVGGLTPTRLHNIESTSEWTIEINGLRFKSIYSSRGLNPIRTTRGNPMKKLMNLTIIDLTGKSVDGLSLGGKVVFIDDSEKVESFCETFSEYDGPVPAAVIHMKGEYKACKPLSFQFPIFELRSFSDSDENLNNLFRGQINLASTVSVYEYLSGSDTNTMRLADYSSKGPSPLGLNKPDVVVPGTAHSSCGNHKSLTTDDLSVKSGTSMATPAAAGTCSLIRQYFYDGFYPYRTKNHSKSFVPTSYLIRAVLINSASPFNSNNYGPNIETGFGSPNVSSSLLDPLRIVKKTIIHANEKHKYYIKLDSTNLPLRITLGYIDPPLELTSPMPLFADLDLLVISPSGQLFRGNERPKNQTEMANTIERVIIKKEQVEIGKYTILVLSNNFSDPDLDSVNYSIVINGPFDHFNFDENKENLDVETEEKSCEFQCLNNGKCGNRGICECDSNHAGFDCSIEYSEMVLKENYKLSFFPNENQNFKASIGQVKNRTNITISVKLNTNDKYSSLLLYASDMKFNSISDANVIPVQIPSNQNPTLNMTILPKKDENNVDDSDEVSIYLTLKIVSAYNFDIDISLDFVDFPLPPDETPFPSETLVASDSPAPSSSDNFVVPVPSASDVVLVDLPSNEPFIPPHATQTESLNLDNLATHVYSIKGLSNIALALSCAMIALCLVLVLFLIVVLIQRKRKNEIDRFYAREEEPKLTIVEKDVDI